MSTTSPQASNERPLRDAATIIITRSPAADADHKDPFEVFMVKRSSRSSFMANAYVYPGGALDEADCDPKLHERLATDLRTTLKTSEDPARALGLYMAGIRETFEEAGLLLASRRGEEKLIDLNADAQIMARFARHREDLRRGAISLLELALAEDLCFWPERLAYFSRWITPYFESKRFDARFFVAYAPRAQEASHDQEETTASRWISPTQAIEAYERGELYLAPPTYATLWELKAFESVQALFERFAQQTPPTILPHLVTSQDMMTLLLPNDPDYPHDDPLYASATRGGAWRRVELSADQSRPMRLI